VAAALVADRPSLAAWLGADGEVNSLDRPRLEFYRLRARAVSPDARRAENLAALDAARPRPLPAVDFDGGERPAIEAAARIASRIVQGLVLLDREAPARVGDALRMIDEAAREGFMYPTLRFDLRRAYRRALELDPDAAGARIALAELLMTDRRFEEALLEFKEAVRRRPDDARAQNGLGLLLGTTGNFPEALSHLEQAVRIDPALPQARLNLGLTLVLAGRVAQALPHFEEAVRLRRDDALAMGGLALVLATHPDAAARDPRRALELAESAAALTGNRMPSVLDALAAAQAASGQFDRAVATVQAALALAVGPGSAGLQRELQARLELYRGRRPYVAPPAE
jgi:tetratricopeptide (TPR) repeat protein